jgi:hypothetical protein
MKQPSRVLSVVAFLGLCLLIVRSNVVMENAIATGTPRSEGTDSETYDSTTAVQGTSAAHHVTGKYNVVLSCFYRTKTFYHGRATPSFDWVLVFLRSLLRHAKNTRVYLWVDDETFGQIASVTGDLPSGYLSVLKVDVKEDVSADWAAKIGNGANNFRFKIYQRWLEEHVGEVDKVLFSDVTDVAFQADPFVTCKGDSGPALSDTSVVFTTESGAKTFSNEKYNKRWMSCYGVHVVNQLKGRRISCAGVTIGGAAGMKNYAAAQIAQISTPALVDCAVNRIQAALDQATHNYILHLGKDASFDKLVSSHEKGCVFHGNFGKPRVTGEEVVNDIGEPYAIVHQYTSNRHPVIMEIMKKKYLHKSRS